MMGLNVDNAILCSAEMKQLYAHMSEMAWLVNDIKLVRPTSGTARYLNEMKA
jgi:hypothetical protein